MKTVLQKGKFCTFSISDCRNEIKERDKTGEQIHSCITKKIMEEKQVYGSQNVSCILQITGWKTLI